MNVTLQSGSKTAAWHGAGAWRVHNLLPNDDAFSYPLGLNGKHDLKSPFLLVCNVPPCYGRSQTIHQSIGQCAKRMPFSTAAQAKKEVQQHESSRRDEGISHLISCNIDTWRVEENMADLANTVPSHSFNLKGRLGEVFFGWNMLLIFLAILFLKEANKSKDLTIKRKRIRQLRRSQGCKKPVQWLVNSQ